MIDALGVIGTMLVFVLGVVGISFFGGMCLAVLGCTYEESEN